MFKILSTLFCILTTSFLAGYHPTPGDWSLVGQYLYLQPSVDDTYFVIESRPISTDENVREILIGSERSNQFQFASAYRVGLEYAFCDCYRGFGVYYTNLNTSHRKSFANNFLSPTIGIEDFTVSLNEYEGKAASKISIDYESLDLLFGDKIYQCCGFDFGVLLGIEFARLHFHQHVNYLPLLSEDTYSSKVNQSANTQAVGPKIGFDFDYCLTQICSCFPGTLNLNLFSTGSLLVSRPKARTNIIYEFNGITYPYKIGLRKSTKVIPAFHIGVGLNYNFCGGCYTANVGIGYEFSSYVKSLLRMNNSAYYGGGLTDVHYSDFDAQGLFVSLAIEF